MAGPITSGNHPKSSWPGIHAHFGREYNKHPLECTQIFNVQKSNMSREEDVRITGFGLAPVKPEGSSTTYTSESQGDTTTYTHTAYSLGYIVTKEELDDNLYAKVSKTRSAALAFSMRTTKEIIGANILNRGFNSSYTGGDGKELFATDHPSLAGNQSNELATPADLSEAALEDMLIDIMEAKNYNGLQIALRGECLIVPPSLAFEAQRILRSTLSTTAGGTGDGTFAKNDINAMRSMGLLPKGYIVNHYLTDSDAWFIKTDAPNGLTCFMRKGYEFTRDNDFDTDSAKAKAYERYSFGWSDWLGAFGTAGAA